jgi:hypothetical protein
MKTIRCNPARRRRPVHEGAISVKSPLALALLIGSTALAAADPAASVLTDQEQQGIYEMFDMAVRAQGMKAAPAAVFIWNKIQTSPRIAPPAQAPGNAPDKPAEPVKAPTE